MSRVSVDKDALNTLIGNHARLKEVLSELKDLLEPHFGIVATLIESELETDAGTLLDLKPLDCNCRKNAKEG